MDGFLGVRQAWKMSGESRVERVCDWPRFWWWSAPLIVPLTANYGGWDGGDEVQRWWCSLEKEKSKPHGVWG